jgi:hypothetical protein
VLAGGVIAGRCASPKTAATYAYSAMFMACFKTGLLLLSSFVEHYNRQYPATASNAANSEPDGTKE